MANFEVPVVKIDAILPIDGADSIEVAVIAGYRSVISKGQFKEGDIVVYIPEQAILPAWLIETLGLTGKLAGPEKNRVKAIRLRGVVSQGLIVEVDDAGIDMDDFAPCVWSSIGYCGASEVIMKADVDSFEELIGYNAADDLGITKYEPEIPAGMAGEFFYVGVSRVCPHFDVENYKKYPDVLINGEEVEFTEKIHGCKSYETILNTLEFGPLPIGDIVEQRMEVSVKSFNHTLNINEYQPITEWSNMPNNNDWYELETEDGTTIKLTGDDRVWLPELNCYRKVRELKENDVFLWDDDIKDEQIIIEKILKYI